MWRPKTTAPKCTRKQKENYCIKILVSISLYLGHQNSSKHWDIRADPGNDHMPQNCDTYYISSSVYEEMVGGCTTWLRIHLYVSGNKKIQSSNDHWYLFQPLVHFDFQPNQCLVQLHTKCKHLSYTSYSSKRANTNTTKL